MWVVKLGGSLAHSPALLNWLETLASLDIPIVIVPGGGPFADEVRRAQTRWRFSDEAAHRMAILAMRQYGLMLADLRPALAATELDAIADALLQGATPVWLPAIESLSAAGIAASWDVTSDSLAAWLAGRLGAAHLALVKSVAAPALRISCAELVAQGIIDRAFSRFAEPARFQIWLYSRDEHQRFATTASHCAESARRSSASALAV